MGPITITKEEYKELVGTRKKIETILRYAAFDRRPAFKDESFGILKNSFGKESSAKYVSRIRKSWRK